MTQETDSENYWLSELRSLGVKVNRRNELNNKEEFAALAENIKQVYYQEYKTAYSKEIDPVANTILGLRLARTTKAK